VTHAGQPRRSFFHSPQANDLERFAAKSPDFARPLPGSCPRHPKALQVADADLRSLSLARLASCDQPTRTPASRNPTRNRQRLIRRGRTLATAPDQPIRRNAPADQAGGISDGGGIGIAFFRLAGARLAADFFAADFLPADFFAAVLLAEDFFAEAFLTAPLRVAFFATTLRADFFAGFLAADFFAVFLVAAFGMYRVPLNRLRRARISAPRRCRRESTFVFIPRKSCTRA
jgi:hypothetical protein